MHIKHPAQCLALDKHLGELLLQFQSVTVGKRIKCDKWLPKNQRQEVEQGLWLICFKYKTQVQSEAEREERRGWEEGAGRPARYPKELLAGLGTTSMETAFLWLKKKMPRYGQDKLSQTVS